jgi:spore germination cell wall hydrolase CwlJ-like protein
VDDPTGGATHYHVRGLLPAWAREREPSAEIGNHLFYNDVE